MRVVCIEKTTVMSSLATLTIELFVFVRSKSFGTKGVKVYGVWCTAAARHPLNARSTAPYTTWSRSQRQRQDLLKVERFRTLGLIKLDCNTQELRAYTERAPG